MKHLFLSIPLLLAPAPSIAETVTYFVKVDSCEYTSVASGRAACDKQINLIADTYTREVVLNVQLENASAQVQFVLDAQIYEVATVRHTVGFIAGLRGRLDVVKHAEKDSNGYRWSGASGSCAGGGAGNIECKAVTKDDIFSLKLKGIKVK